eukprot:2545890-Amphidinium_carterae.1
MSHVGRNLGWFSQKVSSLKNIRHVRLIGKGAFGYAQTSSQMSTRELTLALKLHQENAESSRECCGVTSHFLLPGLKGEGFGVRECYLKQLPFPF